MDTSQHVARISIKTMSFRCSITEPIGPQKFETCPDWGAKQTSPPCSLQEVNELLVYFLETIQWARRFTFEEQHSP